MILILLLESFCFQAFLEETGRKQDLFIQNLKCHTLENDKLHKEISNQVKFDLETAKSN